VEYISISIEYFKYRHRGNSKKRKTALEIKKKAAQELKIMEVDIIVSAGRGLRTKRILNSLKNL
jgi:electron transfer flavoprotein alpha subunit